MGDPLGGGASCSQHERHEVNLRAQPLFRALHPNQETPHYNLWIITDLLWRRLNCRRARNWVTRAGLVCCREPLWEETRLVSKCAGCYGDLIRDFFCETCHVEPLRWSLLGVTAMRKMINYLSAVCHSDPERQSSDSSYFMSRPNIFTLL